MLLPKLNTLLISYNNLTHIPDNLIKDLPTNGKISVVGNPWQCPCWFKLRQLIYDANLTEHECARDFLDGKYPVCVTHEDSNTGCIRTDIISEEYSAIYYEGLAKFGPSYDCHYPMVN